MLFSLATVSGCFNKLTVGPVFSMDVFDKSLSLLLICYSDSMPCTVLQVTWPSTSKKIKIRN